MAAAIIPILNIALAAEPELVALVKVIGAIRAKYPTLTQAQIVTVVQQITGSGDTEFDAVIAKIQTDQAQPH